MWHVGYFDDNASVGRDPPGPQHPREIRGAPTGFGVGQATGTRFQNDGMGGMVAL